MKFYEVEARCGHVGRNNYIIKKFYIRALDGKEAALKTRKSPRVKHHSKKAIVSVTEINYEDYVNGLNQMSQDPYFLVHSSTEQRRQCEFGENEIIREDCTQILRKPTHAKRIKIRNMIEKDWKSGKGIYMNKIKMGKFLKELRIKKGLSQPDLAKEFAKEYLDVSSNAISSWEKGKSIPDIDKLNFLADFYSVTVDDILDGEKYVEQDFNEIYHLHQPDYFVHKDFAIKYSKKDPDVNPYFFSSTDEAEFIRKKFKKIVTKILGGNVSRSEIKELSFLINHYYILNEDFNISSYIEFLRSLSKKNLPFEEKWWEVQRYITPLRIVRLLFANISDEEYKKATVQRRMDFSEQWEKDFLLATVQVSNPIFNNPNDGNSKYIEKYEKEHGKQFDKEEITKNVIKYLIENGAVINENFLSYQKGETYTTRTIDALEGLYNKYKKPIPVCVKQEGKLNFYLAENNSKNRLFSNYDYDLVRPLRKLGYSYDEIYSLVYENLTIPNEVYKRMAKLEGIDSDRETRFLKADLKYGSDMFSLEHYWPQYYEEEHPKGSTWEDDLKMLESKLSNKEYVIYKTKYHLEGGTNETEKLDYVVRIKTSLSFDDFQKGRKINKTKELLESLDSLTIKQIREKYFNFRGEVND